MNAISAYNSDVCVLHPWIITLPNLRGLAAACGCRAYITFTRSNDVSDDMSIWTTLFSRVPALSLELLYCLDKAVD